MQDIRRPLRDRRPAIPPRLGHRREGVHELRDQIAERLAVPRGERIEVGQEPDPIGDPVQLAFELYAPLELANYLSTLNRDGRVVELGRRAILGTIARARPRSGSS